MKHSALLFVAVLIGLGLLLLWRWSAQPGTEASGLRAPAALESAAPVERDRVELSPPGATPPSGADSPAEEPGTRVSSERLDEVRPEPPVTTAAPELAPDSTAWFSVSSARDGAPLAGASLWSTDRAGDWLLGVSDKTGLLVVAEQVDDEGDPRPPGAVVWFKARGHTTRYLRAYSRSTSRRSPMLVTLLEDARLDVLVVDALGNVQPDVFVRVRTTTSDGTPTVEPIEAAAQWEPGFLGGEGDGAFVNLLLSNHEQADQPRIGGGGSFARSTGDSGAALFSGLPADEPLSVTINWEDVLRRQPELVTVAPGARDSLTVTVPARFSISGTVVDASTGAPLRLTLLLTRSGNLDGIDLGAVRESSSLEPSLRTVSEEDGSFRFEGLSEGLHYIGTTRYAGESLRAWVSSSAHLIRVGEGELLDGIVLRLTRGLYVTGVVVDQAGDPVRNVRLVLRYGERRGTSREARTNASGAFRLGPLDPGSGQLEVVSPQTALATPPVRVSGGDTKVEVVLAASPMLELELVDANGEPLELREIAVSRGGQLLMTHELRPSKGVVGGLDVQTTTDSNPDALAPLPAGAGTSSFRLSLPVQEPVDVVLTSSDGRIGLRSRLRPGSADNPPHYTVEASAPAHVRFDTEGGLVEVIGLRYLPFGGEQVAHVHIFCGGIPAGQITTTPGRSGTFSVPPGPITLEVTVGGRVYRRSRKLDAGETWDFTIRF